MYKILVASTLALFLTPVIAADKGDFIRLVDGLDEPEEFYCIDLAGWGEKLRLDDPLQVHTCKKNGGSDQMFSFEDGKITVTGTDRCLQVAGSSDVTLAGSTILARTCADHPLQNLTLEKDGKISINNSGLCLASGEDSTEASGPSHMWRVMMAAPCSGEASLLNWQVGLK